VSGYLLRSGSAAIGGHGIPEDAACLPNWVRRDLEKGGVIGFEPGEPVAGRLSQIQWKGTTSRTVNGTIVRMHEIANAGKPILDSTEPRPVPYEMRRILQHAAITKSRGNLIVLHSAIDEAICVVKY
jgi:hypothetical protein